MAEITLLRLFSLLENTLASVSSKLLCNAQYLDGTIPQRLVSATSSRSAQALMRSHGRRKPLGYLSWTQSKSIRQNLKNTLAPADPFFSTILTHAAWLTEIRYVRNQIAHSNAGTRENFRKVIRQHYGGLKRGVTPGVFLLTPALGPPGMLHRYLAQARVFIKDVVRT